jgi:hypothetical protein
MDSLSNITFDNAITAYSGSFSHYDAAGLMMRLLDQLTFISRGMTFGYGRVIDSIHDATPIALI